MQKKLSILLIAALILGSTVTMFATSSKQPKGSEQIILEVRASQPEYMAKERQLWDIFEQQNPDIKIDLFSINETEDAAYETRIAAGNPPGFSCLVQAGSIQQAEPLADLKTVDFKYWDNFTYDAKNAWKNRFGVDKTPLLQWGAGPLASFLYYKDEMAKANLDPTAIRTVSDLDAFLAKLKKYVDSHSDVDYVIATGWHPWCWPYMFLHHIITAFDPDAQAKAANLYTGKSKWTNLNTNPYVPAFAKLKEWYDLGYLPFEFWTLAWEGDFEAAFIARKGILTFHGPWIWDKVEAADPSAQLGGFPLPANSAGKVQAFPPDTAQGYGIYEDVKKDPVMLEAAVRALNFTFSPEGVKALAETLGSVPAYDLSSVGGANLQSTQFLEVIKPVNEGEYGDASWDSTPFGCDAGGRYYIEGRPNPSNSDPLVSMWGDYFSGKIDMQKLMAQYQAMFDNAYDIP